MTEEIIYTGDIIDNPLLTDDGIDIEDFLIEASRWLTSFR